jgi:ATP-dependent DNA helicase PIF1
MLTSYSQEKHRYEPLLQFKKHMRVVLQHNLDPEAGLVNGSQGMIIGFEKYDESRLPRARKESEGRESDAPSIVGSHASYQHYEIRRYAEENDYQPWPIVQFDDGQIRTIYPDCATNELGDASPFSLLSRTQIPLVAGYAITVHKAQGMTMDKVKVNLQKAFEPSHVYVARTSHYF